MPAEVVVPYTVSQIAALVYFLTAWRWPRAARFIAAIGFILAGGFNIWSALGAPESYVEGFGPYALPPYREFIYGAFARHTAVFVVAIACGQIAVGLLAFARPPWRTLSYIGAIVFLLAILPLGLGSAAPSTLIFALGIGLLLRRDAQERA